MIEINITPPILNKVILLLSRLDFNFDKQSKIDQSIIREILLKFARKSFSLLGKDKTKSYKITVSYYQAEAMERKLRFKANFDYERHQLNDDDFFDLTNFYNYLNQKIA